MAMEWRVLPPGMTLTAFSWSARDSEVALRYAVVSIASFRKSAPSYHSCFCMGAANSAVVGSGVSRASGILPCISRPASAWSQIRITGIPAAGLGLGAPARGRNCRRLGPKTAARAAAPPEPRAEGRWRSVLVQVAVVVRWGGDSHGVGLSTATIA
jgi:hypothetical protein